MRNSTEEFIKSCSDQEICALYYFKGDTYLNNTKKLLKSELRQRGIKEKEVPDILEKAKNMKRNKDDLVCSRCSSKRIKLKEETSYNTTIGMGLDGLIGKDYIVTVEVCEICDYKIFHRYSFTYFFKQKILRPIINLFKSK